MIFAKIYLLESLPQPVYNSKKNLKESKFLTMKE